MEENSVSQTKQQNSWSQSDQEELISVLSVVLRGQKTYSEQSLKDTFGYYKMKLDGRFPVASVIKAIDLFTDKNRDMPTPADLIALMEPPKPKVSHAEFIHAKDQWAKEGYPQFSYYHMIVRQYEKENGDERAATAPIEDHKIAAIIQGSVKRIGS